MHDTTATSHYSPNTDADREAMLAAIGVESAAELFGDIPEDFRFPALDIPAPLSEFELRQELGDLAALNATPGDYACFLGAGSYRHHVPAIVRALAFRGEFLTSYTPYQPEVSQGTLQAHYEFQTLICQLTGMEVANAGMYDGATSLAEAAMMAARITKRNRIVLAETVSPSYQSVVRTYTQGHDNLDVDVIAADGSGIPEDAACVVVQQPDFFGNLHDLETMASQVHELGALLIVSVDLASLGMFKPPGSYDADIVVAEGQTLGVSPSYGGPYVGVLACKRRQGLPPAAARTHRRPDGRHRGAHGLRPHAPDPRAAHPPGARDIEHLHVGRPHRAHVRRLHGGPGKAGTPA